MAEHPHKRKQRGGAGASPRERMERGYARAEERNQAAREALKPLAAGERPRAVTVGVVVSALIAVVFWISAAVAAFTDETVRGQEPSAVPLAAFALLMTMIASGMWKARYWAVLGFQMMLALFLLAGMGGLISATTVAQALGTTLLLIGSGTLFYFMVKAMARIQMPVRK